MMGVSLTPEFHEMRRFFTEVKDSLPAADDESVPVASQQRLLAATARLVARGGQAVNRKAITPKVEQAFHGAAEALQEAADAGMVDLVAARDTFSPEEVEDNRQLRARVESIVTIMDQMAERAVTGAPAEVDELPTWINDNYEIETSLATAIAGFKTDSERHLSGTDNSETMERELLELQERAQKRHKAAGSE